MTNKEIVFKIMDKLEKGHINLWHDITKEEMYSRINVVEWDKLDDVSFDFEMMKLFSLFKDAHTRYFVKNKTLSNKLIFKDDKLYVLSNSHYLQIISINGIEVEKIYNEFAKLVCYETKEWKNKQVEIAFNSKYYYEMIGIKGELTALLRDSSSITLKEESKEEKEKRCREFKPYSYEIMDEVLYLRYSACRDDKDILFSDFVSKIKEDVTRLKIGQYILDVRGNAGGNSEILNSFQDLVREEKLDGVLLMDSGVFSSGRFALAKFKKEFNTLLIGTPSGGAASSYGYNNNDSVENKNFSYSIRYWDFSEIFKTSGAIIPDIIIENTIEDMEKNYDRVLLKAFEVLKNKLKNR